MYTTYSEGYLDIKPTEKVIQTSENELVDKYDLENCIRWITENNFQTTCLQFPDDLLNDGTSIAIYLQNALNKVVYVLGDTSYGSCCVDEVAAEHVNGDSIIHFGHACLSPVVKLPVFYVFEKKNLTIRNLVESLGDLNGYIVVFYSDEYYHLYDNLCSAFQDKENVCISKLQLSHKSKINEDEEIICGRIFTRKPGEEIIPVYIGDNSVTLQNITFHFSDVTFYVYTEEERLEKYKLSLEKKKFLLKRNYLIEQVKKANVIGILIGTLGIKNYLDAIERLKLLAKMKGKKCYIIAVGKPNAPKLFNFPEIDVFVLISCQENALLESFKHYYKPVVSLMEVEIALGNRPYSMEYTLDFRELLPGGSFYKEIKPDSESDSNSNMSQELLERNPGTVVEYGGAQFLANRSWRGLEQNLGQTEATKAVEGRSGIPQFYENELKTFSRNEAS